MPENREFQFVFENTICKVKCNTIESPRRKDYVCQNAYLYNKQDKYGLLNNSKITISINEFIEPRDNIDVNRELKGKWRSVSRAIEVWNYFLNIKVATKEYWLDSINEFMILNYDTEIYAGDIELRRVPLSYSLGLTIGTTIPCGTAY